MSTLLLRVNSLTSDIVGRLVNIDKLDTPIGTDTHSVIVSTAKNDIVTFEPSSLPFCVCFGIG